MMQQLQTKLQTDSKIEKFLKTADNINIAINHYKSNKENLVIICHGWFMTKDSQAFSSLANDISADFDVITFDFRGHGKSSGIYTFTSKEENDINTVVNYAKEFNYKNINLIGFSLGAAQVLTYASHNNVSSIIAVSPPTDFYKIENHVWKPEAWIPTLKKFELKRWISIRPCPVFYKKTPPIDIVQKITTPTLFVLGEKDPVIYPWHTKKLYEKAVCDKKLEIFETGKHAEDLYLENREKFLEICTSWIKQKEYIS